MPPTLHRIIRQALVWAVISSLSLPASAFAMPIEEARPLAPGATYTVTSTVDDESAGTLRWAISQANVNTGSDTIDFAIGAVGSQQTITLTAALPTITDPVVIDGWSQGGASYTGAPLIELNGAGSVTGLTLSGSSSTVRGLVLNRFSGNGITIASSNNKIQGDYIGTDVSGGMAQGNGGAGVFISSGSGNTIGTDGDGVNDVAERNLISGNGLYGINVNSGDGNRISGNLIGTNAAGDSAIPNSGAGVVLFTSNNLVGSDGNGVGDAAERNVISGNLSHPMPGSCYEQPGDGVTTVMNGNGNHIAGNYIGLNEAGTAAIQNDCEGVSLGSNNNIVGTDGTGDSVAQRNVISNNRIANVRVFYMSGNVIAGNYIGTDAAGETASTVGLWGVYIDAATSNRLGTNGDGTNDTNERNIIAGNQYIGVDATGGSGNTIAGNWIGLSASGAPLGNNGAGISIDNGSSNNTVGTAGTEANPTAMRNVISANNGAGISIQAGLWAGSDNNVVAGNYIGTNASATTVTGYGNQMGGIQLSGGSNLAGTTIVPCTGNRIGTDSDFHGDAAEPNIIGGNGWYGGISISFCNSTTVWGNYIGTDATHTRNWGNNNIGLHVWGGSNNDIFENYIWYNGVNGAQAGIRLNPGSMSTSAGTLFDPAINNTLSGNDIAYNGGNGIESIDTENDGTNPAPGDGPGDNTIDHNAIHNNGADGILNYGSSPAIYVNTIENNPGSGIKNTVDFGSNASPATANDDWLSRPIIGNVEGANTVQGNCTGGPSNCAGIFSLDTAPTNVASLESENTIAANNGAPWAEQRWHGTVEVIHGAAPIASSVALSDNAGGARTLSYSTGPCANLNNTIIHGDQSNTSCNDVTTWPLFTEYTVDANGLRTDYMPITSTSPATAVYSFDATSTTNPTDTGMGFSGEGITTGLLSRYQVMQVTIVDQPIVGLTADNDSPTNSGNTTSFTATVTSGDNIVYSWDFGDGTQGTGQYPSHIYGAIGYYTAIVTATNSETTLAATTPVTITDLPIVGLTASNDSPTILGNSTNFTATVTSGDNAVYSWDFGDGNTGTGPYPAHTYSAIGYYTAIVTATNSVSSLVATTPITITTSCTSGLVVSNTNDSGCGSLRYAVSIATPGDTVTFTPTLAGQTITLTTGQIIVDKSITIDGSNAPDVTVNGNDTYRVFNVYTDNDVTLNALIVVHGRVGEGTGAGISNAGTLTVSNSTIAYNDSMVGGGLYNNGTLTLLNSTLRYNTGNEGSGFYNAGIAIVLADTFAQNQASWSGGAIYNGFNAVLTMTNSTLSANSVTDVEMGLGGGIYNGGSLAITSSTIYSNTSPVANTGGGLYNEEGADLTLANTLLAHSDGGDCYNIGTIAININNLVQDGSCNAALSGDPLLGALANNGGPTLTHLPQTGSPVIDGGNNASAAGLTYDQRGAGFPRIVNGTIDIGAVETAASDMLLTASNDSPTVLGNLTNFTATLTTLPQHPSGIVPYSYTWDFGDGGALAGGATASHVYGAVGFYTAIVTMSSPGFTLTATTPVTIVDQTILNLTAINNSPTVLGSQTHLTATVASGSDVVYSWSFGDGLTGSGQYPAHVYGAIGLYTAIVTATNSVGSLTAATPVTVTDQPILSVAAINDSPTMLGNSTSLTATIVSGSNVVYSWNFGDGATGAGQYPAHSYSAVGFYTALVTATNSVSSLTTTTRVTITDQPILNLLAVNDGPTTLGHTTQLTATATGSNIVYTWAFGDGTAGTGATPAHLYPVAGVYTATVTATNSSHVAVATTRVTIIQPPVYRTCLPLITNNFFTAPDLIVQSITASRDVITVVIKNVGDAPVEQSFWVDAYVAPNPPPTAVNQIWWDQNRSQQGVAWAITDPIVPIQPGQVITLTSNDQYVSLERTYFTGNLPVGTPIYAQVDSYNFNTNYGAVLERHEILGLPYNNILGPVLSRAGVSPVQPVITLPLSSGLRYSRLPVRPERP